MVIFGYRKKLKGGEKMFIPYPDEIKLALQDCFIVLESLDPSPEGSYSLTLYVEGEEGGRIPYEYGYAPWGCSPCGLHTPCGDCRGCDGNPTIAYEEALRELVLWLENELRNRGRIQIRILPRKKEA